jgi:hypothetical protein
MTSSSNTDREALAKLLHERFAPSWVDHWDDLDEDQQRDTEAAEMADAILAEFLPAHDERVRAEAWDKCMARIFPEPANRNRDLIAKNPYDRRES